MSAVPVPRWAVSFADLGLLLLGCFVLLHAMESARPKAGAADAPRAEATPGRAYAASDLFEPGEAVLRPEARIRLLAEASAGSTGSSSAPRAPRPLPGRSSRVGCPPMRSRSRPRPMAPKRR
jgi:hypothetical protein